MDDKVLAIVKKVRALYTEYGIKSVTMDDVAHELSISKKTLYQHFADKKELVLAVLKEDYRKRQVDFSSILNNNVNAIEELFLYYKLQLRIIRDHKPSFVYDLKKYYPDIFNHFQVIKRERILDSVRENLIKGKKEGLYRSDLNEDVITRLNLMRIEGVIHSGIFTAEEMVSPDMFLEVYKYHMYGIVSEKGRKTLEYNLNKLSTM
ncbi:MAG: TetR/AcrR family transcriptional regulator [Bacteroidales bacterium]|nr:TetR/AcrR family transcriptional regulator [Bacteroidales bacterium]